jgi:hypothetical protein
LETPNLFTSPLDFFAAKFPEDSSDAHLDAYVALADLKKNCGICGADAMVTSLQVVWVGNAKPFSSPLDFFWVKFPEDPS